MNTDRPLRIVLLTRFIAPFTVASGIGQLYQALAEGLHAAGHSVTVIGIGIRPELHSLQPWGEIISLPKQRKTRFIPLVFQESFVVAKELFKRRGSYDVADTVSSHNLTAFILDARLAVIVRAVTSIVTDSDRPMSREIAYWFFLEWLALLRANVVFMSTEYITSKTRSLYRLSLPHVARVPLGIADIPFEAPVRNVNASLLRLLVIASAGRRKGTDVLILALARVIEITTDFEVTIVEPRWARYEEYVERHPELERPWRRIIDKLGPKLRILMEIDDKQKLTILRATDYLLMTSRSESFGMPVIEAMRSGVPVISSRCGALGEVAGASNQTLFYDDPEDYVALSDLIVQAVEQGQNGAALRRNETRSGFIDRYDAATLVRRSIEGYRDAINVKRRTRSSNNVGVPPMPPR